MCYILDMIHNTCDIYIYCLMIYCVFFDVDEKKQKIGFMGYLSAILDQQSWEKKTWYDQQFFGDTTT